MADAKTQLISKTDYLDEILELFQDGIYITDNKADTIYLNHSYERISGLTVADMLGKNMKTLVEQGVISMSGTLKVLETGEKVTMDQAFSTGRHAIITSIPIKAGGGQLVMVVTIVREMTEIYTARKEMKIQEHLKLKYRAELEQLRHEVGGQPDIVAESGASRKFKRMIDHVNLIDATVFLCGEKGTGKRHIAAYIHRYSKRADKAFLRINFSAMPKDDPAGYLFGRKGSEGEYQIGMLESAIGGTVYFEDLADMPSVIQDRILSILRDGQCVMGDGMVHKMDIRIIAGSMKPLEIIRKEKNVSPDIIYALSMFTLTLPPLRDRKEDIIPLADRFLERLNRERGSDIRLSKEACERMLAYGWPENVIELDNKITRATIVCNGTIEPEDLFFKEEVEASSRKRAVPDELPVEMDLREEVAAFEADYMKMAFAKFGNIRDAAEYLGMDASTFTRKRQKYVQMKLM